jgi:hypothetical protein
VRPALFSFVNADVAVPVIAAGTAPIVRSFSLSAPLLAAEMNFQVHTAAPKSAGQARISTRAIGRSWNHLNCMLGGALGTTMNGDTAIGFHGISHLLACGCWAAAPP